MSMTPFAEEQAQYKAAYAEYQKNTTAAAQLTAEILTGLKEGKPIAALFLLAMQALTMLTHDKGVYEQATQDLTAVYAYALKEPGAAAIEAAAIRERIDKMQATLTAAGTPDDMRTPIEKAIRAHRKALEAIE